MVCGRFSTVFTVHQIVIILSLFSLYLVLVKQNQMKKTFILFAFIFSAITASAQAPVYKDVAAIFYARCTNCHNQNHKYSFLNYTKTQVMAGSIAADLTSGRMPPWHPDTTYTRFCHENLITPAEKTAIQNWITAGALKGDTTQAPSAPVYPKYKLTGNADYTLKAPVFTSNAWTNDSYVCFSIPTGLTQDRYLKAYEIIPGNVGIVHHVVVNVDTTASIPSDLSGGCYTQGGQYSLGGYALGSPPTVFPNTAPLKMGIRIKAGSNLILQVHYPVGTVGQVDSTKIRLFYYPIGTTGVRPVYVTTPLQNWSMSIPANTVKTYSATNLSTAASYSVSIFATFPHSHKICTSLINYACLPGIDTIPLIRINKWDFDFQGFYTFDYMKKVPKSYKLVSKHIYDNTTANPYNPVPANVTAGLNTSNEMLFDAFMYMVYQPGDELINIKALLGADSLLMAGVKENTGTTLKDFTSYAYPNPFENTVKIGYYLNTPSKVNVEIYTMYGTLVKTINTNDETTGLHEVAWDSKNDAGINLAGGTYFYVVKVGNKQSYGKLSLMPSRN